MEGSRIKKTAYNIYALAIYQIALFVYNLILPKLIITNYGSSYNGIIASITQFVGFISILRLGVAGATRVELYKSLALEDIEKTSSIVTATQNVMRRIGYILLGYIAFLAILFPVVINDTYPFVDIAILVVAIGLGTFAQYFFGLTYQTLLDADQRQYIYNILLSILTITNTILSAILILNGLSIQVVKIASASLYFISPCVLNVVVSRKYRINIKAVPDYEALSRRKDAMGHSVANIVHENTDMIVLTLFCGIEIVSVYSVYHLVMSGLTRLLEIFTSSAEAVMGNMWAHNELDKLNTGLSIFEYLITVFVSIVFATTILLIIPFVSLYTKGVNDVNYIVPTYALIIILAQVFYCFRIPYLSIVQATGHYKETKRGAYIEAGVNLILSIIFVQSIGILGTAIGTLVANMFRTVQYAVYTSSNLIKRSIIVIAKRALWSLGNIAITCLCGTHLVNTIAYEGWILWGLACLIILLISTIVCSLTSFIFYRTELKNSVSILVRMIKH